MTTTTITNATVVTMDSSRRVLTRGTVVVKDSFIEKIGGPELADAATGTVIDASGHAVLPGFVNTHHHLAAALMRGLAPDRPLTVTPTKEPIATRLHRNHDEQSCYAGVLLAAAELTRSGVTTTTDSQLGWKGMRKADGSLRAAQESGLRVIFSPAFINKTEMAPSEHHFEVSEAVAEFTRLREEWQTERVTVIPEVMSLPRGTDELITALKEAGGDRMAMHLSYSQEFQNWAHKEYGRSAVEHLDSLGVLDSGFLGAHPIYFSDREVEIYAERQAAGAYCAVSNMLIGVGHLSMRRMTSAGIRMGLGLDYPNHGHNFFETIKVSLLAQKQLMADAAEGSADDALVWATIGGAEALGLDDEIGSLEVGKRADLQIIDLQTVHTSPAGGSIPLLVYSGSPHLVRDVMANGKWLMLDRELVHLNEPEVIERATSAQQQMMRAAGMEVPQVVPAGWTLID